PGGHRGVGRAGLRRSGVHRRGGVPCGGRPRGHPGGREAGGGEARVRAPATTLGGRAVLRLGGAVLPAGAGLRAAPRDAGRAALRRVQLPHAPQRRTRVRVEFITRTNGCYNRGRNPITGGPRMARKETEAKEITIAAEPAIKPVMV